MGSDGTYIVAFWCTTEAFSTTHAIYMYIYIEDCEVLIVVIAQW